APDQSVRLHVLRADRNTRRARDCGRAVAAHARGAGAAAEARTRSGPHRRDHRTVLALRGRGLDRHLHRGLSDTIDAQTHRRTEENRCTDERTERRAAARRWAARAHAPRCRDVLAGRGGAGGAHGIGSRGLLCAGVPSGARAHAARLVGAQVLTRGAVLYAPQDGQPVLLVPVRRPAAPGDRRAGGAAVLVLRNPDAAGSRGRGVIVAPWQRWVVRPLIRPRRLFRVAAVLTRPLPAAVIFSTPITLWHFPGFYEAALRHHPLHIVQHLVFIATAVLMWWPVLSPVPELPRASYLTQLLYLFLLGLPMSLVGALITLSEEVLYPFYTRAPRVWE